MRALATIAAIVALSLLCGCARQQGSAPSADSQSASTDYGSSAVKEFLLLGYVPQTLDTVTSQRLSVPMEYLREDGVRDLLGGVVAWQDDQGTNFKIVVTRFTPGFKGFHLLAHGDCTPVVRNGRLELGGGAGGLYDPARAGRHEGPFGDGYLGALPRAEANANGWIFMTLVAPRLRLADLRGRALVLREQNDSYKSSPPLGGSGGVAACGIVP